MGVRFVALLVLTALLASCGDDGGVLTTEGTAPPAATTSPPTSAVATTAAPPTTTSTTEAPTTSAPTVPDPGLVWARVPHNEAMFGGVGEVVMTAVAAAGPGLVAVGWEGHFWDGEPAGVAAVWTSPDGVTWARVTHDESVFGVPDSTVMTAVTAGGPGVVAVGYGRDPSAGEWSAAVWTSPDGFSWTRVPHVEATFGRFSDQSMNGVTAGGPGLVAVGCEIRSGEWPGGDWDAAVWVSADGYTWTRINGAELDGPGRQVMLAVTAGGPGLVAVGYDTSSGELAAAIWTSADGLNWVRAPDDEDVFGRGMMMAVTAGGPGLVAVGEELGGEGDDPDAAVWVSEDGVAWVRVPHDESLFGGPGQQEMLGVVAGGPGLVAVGGDDCGYGSDPSAAVWVSVDGVAWVRVPHDDALFGGPNLRRMLGVVTDGPGLVAVGEDDATRNGPGPHRPAVWVSPPPG